MSKEDIDYWYSLREPNIKKNLKIVNQEDIGLLLHVSTNGKIKEFIPRISTEKYLVDEDLTTPRISTADTLFGCINSAFNIDSDFIYERVNTPHGDATVKGKYLGGYYIYTFDYEYAIKPNKKAMEDTKFTNEHWLVTYNKQTIKYIPRIIGKFFVKSVTYTKPLGDESKIISKGTTELYLETYEDNIKLTLHKSLNKGTYLIETNNPCYIDITNKNANVIVKEIPDGEFKEKKKLNASLLSYAEPNFLKW